jgi:NAD(P)-dependent dehydrogenase (short-subunit alcohol dehydrogenase family)
MTTTLASVHGDAGVVIPNYVEWLSMRGQGFVVLGAGQGIGEQAAHALAQQGARVLCVDLDADRAVHVSRRIGGAALAADVTSRSAMQRVFAEADRIFGSDLTGVVDVVGMPGTRALVQMDDADWTRQFDLVLTHAHLAIQYGAPLLARRGGGSMVFVGSMAGVNARAGTLLAYGAAKAALHHLIRGAAQELAPQQVRLNVVAPGLTRTPRLVEANGEAFWKSQAAQIPLGRAAETSDIAASILFLGSALARHITGNLLMVDGGHQLGVLQSIARSHTPTDTEAGNE